MNYQDYYNTLNEFEKVNAPKDIEFVGDFNLLLKGRRVSLVGYGQLSENDMKRTSLLAQSLIDAEIVIVGGLDQGISTLAQTICVVGKSSTIAVLDCGLDKCVPGANQVLLDNIKANHLAISVTQNKGSATALISDAIIIAKGSEGWDVTVAEEALRLGREVFVLEHIVNSEASWAKDLVRNGAQILTKQNYIECIKNIPFSTNRDDLEW